MNEQRGFQAKSYAPNSLTTRGVQTRKYLEFIEEFSTTHSPIPCSSEQVALYATWLARSLRYSSILNYLSGLNNFLKQHGSPKINYDDYVIASTLRGIRRQKGDASRQAAPLLPYMLLKIFALLTQNAGHTAWRAATLCCFRGLLRKCQVTQSDNTLLRQDFEFFKWGMLLTVRRSKTIQYGQRVLRIPIARCPMQNICAVYWTERHFSELQASPNDMAFRIPTGGGESAPMTYNIYESTLKLFSEAAGYDPSEISSHSLRRGGCTYLSMCGVTLEELKARGDWASDTVFAYLRTPLTTRILNDMQVASALSAVNIREPGLGDSPVGGSFGILPEPE